MYRYILLRCQFFRRSGFDTLAKIYSGTVGMSAGGGTSPLTGPVLTEVWALFALLKVRQGVGESSALDRVASLRPALVQEDPTGSRDTGTPRSHNPQFRLYLSTCLREQVHGCGGSQTGHLWT